MTPEGVVKDDVKKGLDAYPMPYFMPVQTGYGKRDVDFRCTLPPWGHSLLIETKRADYKGKLTRAQRDALIANAKAGGLSVCALCWNDVQDAISYYYRNLRFFGVEDNERCHYGLFVNYNRRGNLEVQRF